MARRVAPWLGRGARHEAAGPGWAGLAGAAAAALALGVTELVAGLSGAAPSLVAAVGDLVIDNAPTTVVLSSVETLGQGDKASLLFGIVVISLLIGIGVGRAARHRPWVGIVAFAAFATLGAYAGSRVLLASDSWSAIAAFAGGAAGAVALLAMLRLAPGTAELTAVGPTTAASAGSRRGFIGVTAAAVLSAVVAAAGGRALGRRFGVEAAREDVVLPPPVRSDGRERESFPEVAGITPFLTTNQDFYRIDIALLVPQIDPDSWRLRISGMVDRPIELTFDELLARPLVEETLTLACVSNEVGGSLIGNAVWLGLPLADLLEEAGVQPGAEQVVGRSVDGFTAGFPIETTRDGRAALVAVGMGGEPLPIVHGFPARLVVAGLYGYVSATKWLSEVHLTTWDGFDGFWVPRGWSKDPPVKTQSRIDVPRAGSTVGAGSVSVAGVAWAQPRGVSRVEVRVDGESWAEADLGDAGSTETWRQWMWRWDASPGEHFLEVRATDGDGEVQTSRFAPPAPSGSTGLHRVLVSVEQA